MDDHTPVSAFSPHMSSRAELSPTVVYPSADWEETGMGLDRISAHAVGLLLNQWTMRTPTATPHPPDVLHFSLALFSGHFPTDEGKQQIMTVKLW